MPMLPALDAAACPDLAVPAQVMRHVVAVESGANPYAIGVVGNRLVRQPRNLEEAVATARMLEGRGYNFSLGASQVNRSNLGKFGLDDHPKAFDFCRNLAAGSRILADCYRSALGNWGKAFSCYYSGDFVTGFRDGYVRKVYDSINRGGLVSQSPEPARAIPLSTDSQGAVPRAPRKAGQALPAGAKRTSSPPEEAAFVPHVRQLAPSQSAPTTAATAATEPPSGDPQPAGPASKPIHRDSAFVF